MLGVRSGKTQLNAWIPLPLDATVAGNDVLQALISISVCMTDCENFKWVAY
jgi:hypothetical protein